MSETANSASTGAPTVDPEIVTPGETGNAYPIPRAPAGIVVRREMVYGLVGVGVGVALTLWIVSMCAERVRR